MSAGERYVRTKEIQDAVKGRESAVLTALGIHWDGKSSHIRCPYPDHEDQHPSWRWNQARRRAHCTCTPSASIFDVVAKVRGSSFEVAKIAVAEMIGRSDLIRCKNANGKRKRRGSKSPGGTTATAQRPGCTLAAYAAAKSLPMDFLESVGLRDMHLGDTPVIRMPYHEVDSSEGSVRFRLALKGNIRFKWRKGSKASLYGLSRLGEARDAGTITVVEGESDCHTLWYSGFPAIGLPGNTNWNEGRDAALLADIGTIYVVIEPGNSGKQMLAWVSKSKIRDRVRLVRLDGFKDPSELYVNDPACFPDRWREALAAAVPWRDAAASDAEKQPSDVDYDAEIARLAALSPRAYEREREAAANRLGLRVGTLDKEVARARGQADAGDSEDPGVTAFLVDPEPWPDAVPGGALLDRLTEMASAHLVLPSGAAETFALWVLHAHAHDCFGISPVLGITSPTPECGKTTLLALIGALVPRACPASNITVAALFRAVEKWRPTLLIDEADTFLRNSDELRGVLNSGHHRATAYVIRTTGDDHEPKRFRTWAPKAVALIGKLPATLASRAIHIELRRKTAAERVEPLRLDRLDYLEPLRRQAARWAADHAIRLNAADPEVPETISGRAADNWRPLFAIADVAGDDWPARARRIAEKFGGARTDQTAGIMLLEDVQRIFVDRGADRLSSADLAAALSAMEDRPWPEWRQGKPITPRQIARLLEPFGVMPGTVRTTSGTAKGYKREQFTDPFARYLPTPFNQTVTPSQTNDSAAFYANSSVTPSSGVTDEKPQKVNTYAGCDGVTVRGRPFEDVGDGDLPADQEVTL
jgi:putative DNA primase/helicase